MGRARKPTAIRIFEGKYVSPHRGEPEPPKLDSYDPPKDLGEIARAKWEEMVKLLQPLAMLTTVDVDALRIYCEAWQEVAACDSDLAKKGHYQKTDGGRLVAHPAVARRQNALDRIRRYMQEFGLTPASRSKVSTSGKVAPKGKLSKYVNGG